MPTPQPQEKNSEFAVFYVSRLYFAFSGVVFGVRHFLQVPLSPKYKYGKHLFEGGYLRFVLSHCWFATVQEVLQADWQDVWHSPQPLLAVFFNVGFAIVLIFFIDVSPRF
jgi:hypothetical protein